MQVTQIGIFLVVSLCCTLSVYPNDISYTYWDIGVALSDRDSEHLSDDQNIYGDIDFSQTLYQKSLPESQIGVHAWVEVTQSRNLSNDTAYTLTLLQSAAGVGVHYSTDLFSTYFRLGTGGSSAKFKTTQQSSSNPVVTGGGGDIFAPPISIFSKDRPRSQTTHTNQEDGVVGKIGVRWHLFENYQIGAAVQWSDIDSIGTQYSTYIQKNFKNSPVNARTTFSPFGGGYMSVKTEATITEHTNSIGLSLVYSF